MQQVIWNLLSNAVWLGEGGGVGARLSRAKAASKLRSPIPAWALSLSSSLMSSIVLTSTSTRGFQRIGLHSFGDRPLHVVVPRAACCRIEPGKGQGAIFDFRFRLTGHPRATGKTAGTGVETTDAAQSNERQAQPGWRHLFCDDLATLWVLKVIPQNRGAEVTTASSVVDALQALEQSLPLVSDLAMPDHDPVQLIAHIRQRGPERGGNMPARADRIRPVEDRVRALTAGFSCPAEAG